MTHLGVLGHAHRAQPWSDDRIAAGGKWKGEIFQAIDSVRLAVLLITAEPAPQTSSSRQKSRTFSPVANGVVFKLSPSSGGHVAGSSTPG
jgi:hypothetical protein